MKNISNEIETRLGEVNKDLNNQMEESNKSLKRQWIAKITEIKQEKEQYNEVIRYKISDTSRQQNQIIWNYNNSRKISAFK